MKRGAGRTLYRYVDWNRIKRIQALTISRRTLYRYVDWNRAYEAIYNAYIRRTLYRYVDWNMTGLINSRSLIVVPYIGTWIETVLMKLCITLILSYLI